MTDSKKRRVHAFRRGDSRWGLLGSPLALVIITAILAFASAIAIFEYERPKPTPEEALTSIPTELHAYSLMSAGRRVSGQSGAPFEKGAGYFARVEACERFGIEGLMNVVSCYLTVRPAVNLVISNSRNVTEARYTDGSPAQICCLFFEDGKHAPIFRIPAPTGAIERRTFERGSEMHLTLNIPNPDPQRELDAVRFSPGEGAPPVLFPIKEGVKDKAFFRASYIEAHRGDSRVEAIIAEGYRMRAEFHAMEEKNRGLTYEP